MKIATFNLERRQKKTPVPEARGLIIANSGTEPYCTAGLNPGM